MGYIYSAVKLSSPSFSSEVQQEKKILDRLQAPELANVAGESSRLDLFVANIYRGFEAIDLKPQCWDVQVEIFTFSVFGGLMDGDYGGRGKSKAVVLKL